MAEDCSRSRSRSRSPVPAELGSSDFWRLQLEAIYRRRNPLKLPQVPALLQKYAGNEAVLYAKVCKTYDLNPKVFHLDPKAWEAYDPGDSAQPFKARGTEAPVDNGPFEVTVSTTAGQNTTIANISACDTVMQIWKKAAANLSIPIWASNLCMGSETLDHDHDLSLIDAGVAAGARLTLVGKPIEQLENAFKQLRTLPEAQAAENPAARATENEVVFVLHEFMDSFNSFTVVGAFKNRSAAVEKAIERVRAVIGSWLDDCCADEDDPSCADKLEVFCSRTSIHWYRGCDGRIQRTWTVQELMIE